MTERFEQFTGDITLAYKYILKLKTHCMKTFDLRASNVMCLFYIGKHEDGLNATELCEYCKEDKAGISKSLTVLKEKNLIFEDNDGGIKKYRIRYKLTNKGEEVYKEVLTFITKAVELGGEGLSIEERLNFYNTLNKIVVNLEKFYGKLEEKK